MVTSRSCSTRSHRFLVCIAFFLGLTVPAGADIRYEYALGGFDSVAFQVDHRPRVGDETYQVDWGGRLWLFANRGNMAAFKQAPEVYAPQFTGCDPYALAQGVKAQGLPRAFAVHDDRLYLFSLRANRFLFLAAPEEIIGLAHENAEKVDCDRFR